MPEVRRGAAAYARLEVDLAAWATTATGREVSSGQVAAWRRAGLLPVPTGIGTRRDGLPGRPPQQWTDAELGQAQALVTRLAGVTGRGTSLTQLALVLADDGLPVPAQTVLDAAVVVWGQMTRELCEHLRVSPILDADDVDRMVQQITAQQPGLVRQLERRIPRSGADEEPGVGAALFALVAMFSGVGLDALDEVALDTTLHVMRAHGVVEGAGEPDGPRLLPGGAGELGEVLALFDLDKQVALLRRFPTDLVHSSLQQSRAFGEALRTAHRVAPQAAHHLGAEATLRAFAGARGVVLRLICWQAIRERKGEDPDVGSLVEAIGLLADARGIDGDPAAG